MRILHLLNHTRRLNGHVHAAVDLACAQVQLGHKVALASGAGGFDALLEANQVETFRIEVHRRPLAMLKSLRKLHQVVGVWRPDVIHVHMVTSVFLARPVCWLSGVPLITTVHNEFEKNSIIMGLGDRVIAVSEAVGRSMRERGVSQRRLGVVLNGTIGAARLNARPSVALELQRPAVLFVGGLHPRKGLPDLMTGFEAVYRRFPEARLYVIGDGPYRDAYVAEAAAGSCAEAIVFLGPQEDPLPFMRGADIFVLPSHAEPAGLVLSEAREAGCAVIGADVGGIPEMLERGKAGMLVPPRDPVALSEAICRLLGDGEELRVWRGRSQYNVDHMRVERVARETVAIYAEATQRRRDVHLAANGV